MNKTNYFKIFRIFLLFVTTFTMCVYGVSAVGTAPNPADTGAYEKFDGNTTDATPNNNDAINYGATLTTGKINQAYSFDGVDDFMMVNDDISLHSTSFSVSQWIYIDTIQNSRLFYKDQSGSNNGDTQIQLNALGGGEIRWQFQSSSSTNDLVSPGLSTGQWYHIVITTDGNNNKLYINNNLEDSNSFAWDFSQNSLDMYLGSTLGTSTFFNGKIDELAIFNKELTQDEITYLYQNGNPTESQQYPFEEIIVGNKTRLQTYYDKLDTTLTITGNNWTQILQGQINITEDNTNNYGSSSLSFVSNQTNEIECRTLLDNVVVPNSAKKRTAVANIVDNFYIIRQNSTLDQGLYNITFECRKIGPGQILIGYAEGIGNVLFNKESNTNINHKQMMINTNINSLTYQKIGEYNFTTESFEEDLNKLIVIDYELDLKSNNPSKQNISYYFEINNNNESVEFIKTAEQNLFYGGGSFSIHNVSNESNNVKIYAKGLDTDLNFTIQTYEQDLESNEYFYNKIKNLSIPYSATATPQTLIEIPLFNNLETANLLLKGGFNIRDNGGLAYIQARVKKEDGTYINGVPVFRSATTDYSITAFEDAITIPTGNLTLEIQGYCTGFDCEIATGEYGVLITNEYQFIDNQFLIQAYNRWNDSQILDFEVFDGNVEYNTTNGNISISTNQAFLDLLFTSNNYLNRNINQIPTDENYNASLFQSIVNINTTEIYTNNLVNNFSLETEEGIFITTTGLLTIYPNLGNYLWNVTFDTYFNKTNQIFNITQSNNYQINNISDTNLTFFNTDGGEIYPNCEWLNNLVTNNYLFAVQNVNSSIDCYLKGFTNLTITPNLIPLFNQNYTLNYSNLNIEVFNELNGNQLALFNATISNGTDTISYINVPYIDLMYKNDSVPKGNIEIFLKANTFEGRKYQTFLDPYSIINLDGYLLPVEEGNFISFFVFNNENEIVSDATITLFKIINNEYEVITQVKTDETGYASAYVNTLDQEQKFIVTKQGYVQKEFVVRSTALEYVIYLSAVVDQWQKWDKDISYKITPDNNILSTNEFNFTYEIIDQQGSLTKWGFKIYNSSNDIISQQESNNNAGGSLNYYNSNISGNVKVDIYYISGDRENSFTKYYSLKKTSFDIQDLQLNNIFKKFFETEEYSQEMKILIWVMITLALVVFVKSISFTQNTAIHIISAMALIGSYGGIYHFGLTTSAIVGSYMIIFSKTEERS